MSPRPRILPWPLAALAGVVAACSPATPELGRTLKSPSDVAPTTLCVATDGSVTIAEAGCGTSATLSFVAVANSGDRFVHRADVASSGLALRDFDRRVPGVTGVALPGGSPAEVEATHMPGVFVAASRGTGAALWLVDLLAGTVVPLEDGQASVPLPSAPSRMRSLVAGGTTFLLYHAPTTDTVEAARLEIRCGDAVDTRVVGCTVDASWTPLGAVPDVHALSDLVVRGDGRWFAAPTAGGALLAGASFGDALARDCGGAPCVFARVGVGALCSNGVDDDGDGLADADDPQCFGPLDDEAGTVVDDLAACAEDAACVPPRAVAACSDGADNDSDGQVDAADPDCESAGDRSETSVHDEVASVDLGDGPLLNPDEQAPAYCESGCTMPRFVPRLPVVSSLALTREGDLLLATDRASNQLLYVDADTLTPVEANVGNGVRSTPGTALAGRFVGPVAVQSLRVTDDDTRRTFRVAHVASAASFAETVLLDVTWERLDADGSPVAGSAVVDVRLEPLDTDDDDATATAGGCVIPVNAAPGQPPVRSCDEAYLPRFADLCEGAGAGDARCEAGAPAYAWLASQTRVSGIADNGAPTTNDVPHDYAIAGGTWQLVYRGALNGSSRRDAVPMADMTEAGGWLRFVSTEPCRPDEAPTLCQSPLASDESCPLLSDWCARGSDAICDAGVDVCALCPALCASTADLCAIGVLPGDELVLERFAAASDEACSSFVRTTADRDGLHYLVCEVGTDRLRIAPFSVGCGGEAVEPPADVDAPATVPVACTGDAWAVSVHSSAWHVRRGSAVGPSPYVRSRGRCVLAATPTDARTRPQLGAMFASPLGVSFRAVAGDCGGTACVDAAVVPREFALNLEVDAAFGFRDTRLRQLPIGPATSSMVVVGAGDGTSIVVADSANNFLAAFSASTWRLTGSLVP